VVESGIQGQEVASYCMKLSACGVFNDAYPRGSSQHEVNTSEKDKHMTIPQYKGQMRLIKRVLPSGCKAVTLAEHRIWKQALSMTKKSTGKDPPGGARWTGVVLGV
jgi:hypothetical protein